MSPRMHWMLLPYIEKAARTKAATAKVMSEELMQSATSERGDQRRPRDVASEAISDA